MSTAISPAIPKTTEPTGRIFDSNNFARKGRTRPMPDDSLKVGNTCATTVRVSSVIYKLIIKEAATRPEKIDASCTTISTTYKPTVGRIRTNVLTQMEAVTSSAFVRYSAGPCSVVRINPQEN